MLIDTHLVYQLTLYYYVVYSDFALIKDAKKEKNLSLQDKHQGGKSHLQAT